MISTVTTATVNFSATVIMSYSIIAVVTLMAFLVAKEILSSDAENSPGIKKFIKGIDIAIVPLLLVFMAILAYKVSTLL